MDPFLYQYALGGVVFVIGMLYAGRQGYLTRRVVGVLVGGLAALALLQGVLEYAPMVTLPAVAYQGDGLTRGVIGTPLDYGVMIAYFLAILAIGTWFGRNQKDTKDFFFGGQRFSWWLIAFSLVATVIGSYSFVKYSQVAYNYGIASSQTYLNDWFWLPLLLFGWLPILYFTRLTSIPEYFEHRFGKPQRRVVTVLLLLYLVGYVGINLFTMGRALETLLGWDVFVAALLVASISAIYVTFGGQTSVIMTDLFQGVMLMATGLCLLVLGALELGGLDVLWQHLPREHRRAFPNFASNPEYNAAGIFWQDGMANSAMFYFLNQGILMRFMAARSVQEGRKAAVAVLAILMPLAAVVVASGGWVGKALEHAGVLPPDLPAKDVFFIAAEFLAMPGLFGLVLAALTAALMSTVDTLITAVAAVFVNDIVRPLRPKSTERELLRWARIASVSVAVLGVALVPVFAQYDSIYAAHGAFTAAITPPMVVALLFGVFWRRFTPAGALATLIGGSLAIVASVVWPELIAPFAHGMPPGEAGEGLFGGAKQYKFMRAFYGLTVSAGIGVTVTLVTRPKRHDEVRGYVWGTVSDAIRKYKGRDGTESYSAFEPALMAVAQVADGDLPGVRLPRHLCKVLEAGDGDLVYLCDRRAWLGGLNSVQARIIAIHEGERIEVSQPTYDAIGRPEVRVQRMY